MPVLTFVDSGVLIAAFRGISPASAVASALLNDTNRQFVTSDFVRLEVEPKATYYHRAAELAYYTAFFDSAHLWVLTTLQLIQRGLLRGSEFGLSRMDALHVATAELAEVDELVTLEKTDKPICRVSSVRVVSIHP